MRLLTQIAVEALQSETFKELNVWTKDTHKFICYAGGFLQGHDKGNDSLYLDMREQIATARHQEQLFPPEENVNNPILKLSKDEQNKIKGKVDFTLNGPETTWEAWIEKNRLIQHRTGPILPKFFKTDPTKPSGSRAPCV